MYLLPTNRRSATKLLVLMLLVVAGTAESFGSSLTNYRTRLESAQKRIDAVISEITNGGSRPGVEPFIRQTISEIRKSLPESEKVEFRGTSVDTANGWLRSKLDEYEQESRDHAQIIILSSVSERLSAIAVRVRELESAVSSAHTKDEDKQKLAEILRREEYQKPQTKEESVFQRWLREFLEWLSSKFPRSNISPQMPSGLASLSVVLQIIIYTLVIVLIGFLIYKFAPLIAARFGKREKKDTKSRVILGERIEASESASDLFAEAEKLARSGDLRGAIRKGYVALLCDLADRKIIGLARHKSNRDYLRDVRKRRALFERMKNATGSFERNWYGFRNVTPGDWEDFREQYRGAVNEA